MTSPELQHKPEAPHQLLQVILDGIWVNHDAHSHQRVEGKVKDLVAEEGDDPSRTQLKERDLGWMAVKELKLHSSRSDRVRLINESIKK